MKHTVAAFLLLGIAVSAAQAGETQVAVAANFTEPATEIAKLFAEKTGHSARLSFGASGQFLTQIAQGAPFEVFLSADAARPAKAIADGLAVPGSDFTYAIGTLVLWSQDAGRVTGPETLKAGEFQHLAIADPKSAPYGQAAIETLETLGLLDTLSPKIVQGTNIAQAQQFVATGNAELGFVALAQVIKTEGGSRWEVPGDLHEPILQDAVLLKVGADNEAAQAFLEFLKGPQSREVIKSFGYDLAPEPATTG